MRGNPNAAPDQDPFTPAKVSNPASPPSPVAEVTFFEYQPVRVLMSVLLTPAARTSMSTSPLAGRGTGQSVRYSSISKPPCPVRITAAMTLGNKVGSFLVARHRHASDIDHDVS